MSEFDQPNPSHPDRRLGLELFDLNLGDRDDETLAASAAEPAEFAETPEQALELAQILRQRNRQLIERVAELEQTLAQVQPALQGRDRLDSSSLLDASQQVSVLFQELEAAHLVAHRQQVLIETLTQQLDAAQAHIAQLERECALAKQHYADQVELAAAAVENSQELRDRLQRQKQQALQFRASLDRYLQQSDSAPPSLTVESEPAPPLAASGPPKISVDLTAPAPPPPAAPLSPGQRGKPIQPWSARANVAASEPSPPRWLDRWLDRAADAAEPATDLHSLSATPPDDEEIPPEVFSETLRAEIERPFYSTEGDRRYAETVAPVEPSAQVDDAWLEEVTRPAPLEVPESAPKKRNSLSAVKLPQFPRPGL